MTKYRWKLKQNWIQINSSLIQENINNICFHRRYTAMLLLSNVSVSLALALRHIMNRISVTHSCIWSHDLDILCQCCLTVWHIITCLWLVILGSSSVFFLQQPMRSSASKGKMFTLRLIRSWHPLQSLCSNAVWPTTVEHCDGWAGGLFWKGLPLCCGWSAE